MMQNELTLLHGDCRRILQQMERTSIDLIVTSPPYANQRKATYGGIHPDAYAPWLLSITAEMLPVMKPTGTFILNIKEPVVKGERHPCVIETILGMTGQGWRLTQEFLWHKSNCFPGKWPNRFRDAYERLLQFNVGPDYTLNESVVKGHPDNVLYGSTVCDNRQHPAAYPDWLPEWFILAFTNPGDVVLDPFLGSGTTAAVALRNGRRAVGIEMHPPYWAHLQRRFRQEEAENGRRRITGEAT